MLFFLLFLSFSLSLALVLLRSFFCLFRFRTVEYTVRTFGIRYDVSHFLDPWNHECRGSACVYFCFSLIWFLVELAFEMTAHLYAKHSLYSRFLAAAAVVVVVVAFRSPVLAFIQYFMFPFCLVHVLMLRFMFVKSILLPNRDSEGLFD